MSVTLRQAALRPTPGRLRIVWDRWIAAPTFYARCTCGWLSAGVGAVALVSVSCPRCRAELEAR